MPDSIPAQPIPAPGAPGPMIAGRSSKEWTTIITLVLGVAGGGSYGMAKMFQPAGYEVLAADVASLKAAAAAELEAERLTGERLARLEAASEDTKEGIKRVEGHVMKLLTRPRRQE